MINILSVGCGLSFTPYLLDCMAGYLNGRGFASRVVKQAGTGLIVRDASEMSIRFQEHEAELGEDEALHYRATLAFRRDYYDILRVSDEVVLANVGGSVLLSHPQSELWLDPDTITDLLEVDRSGESRRPLPEWLTASGAAGRLLLSDQRTGRWVLLGRDHIAELERRVGALQPGVTAARIPSPPALSLKGIKVHLQSAITVAAQLERFAESGEFTVFNEHCSSYSLSLERAPEGIALSDSEGRIALTAREARKYAAIMRDELERRRAVQFERGRLRTVLADADGGGRWVLQWGDEVLAPNGAFVESRTDGGFELLLQPASGGCVALTPREAAALAVS